MAFFLSIRRCSLFETNHRLVRIVLRTPLLTTDFLNLRSSCSDPSSGRNTTVGIKTSPPILPRVQRNYSKTPTGIDSPSWGFLSHPALWSNSIRPPIAILKQNVSISCKLHTYTLYRKISPCQTNN